MYQTFTVRIEEELSEKLKYIADYEGRTKNRQVAVSYTHLDVYKRQVNSSAVCAFILLLTGPAGFASS